jgi:hypothetical protein
MADNPPVLGIPQRIPGAREEALAQLPRIGVGEIKSREALIRRVEDIALDVGDTVEARRQAGDPQWWRSQDLLDDVLDILDFVRKGESA